MRFGMNIGIIFIFVLICIADNANSEDSLYSAVWIDNQSNIRVENARITAQSLKLPGSWSIEKSVQHGGKQEGVDLVILDNGRMRIQIIPTRGMEIWSVNCEDVRLGWDSPVGEIVHPQYVNLEARKGLGWLDGFGGWLVHCGLEYAGAPVLDEIVNNVGSKIEVPLTLHGRIDYIPASRVEVLIDQKPPYTLRVRGIVNERTMFGPNLQLITEISTEPNSLELTVQDRVINNSGHNSEMMKIYHPNFGPPLLQEGSRLVAALERITPRDERAAEAKPEEIFVYPGPQPSFVEQVFFLKPLGDNEGVTEILLHNAEKNRGAVMSYSIQELPCLTLWKNMTNLKDGYATGIEPGLNYSTNRKIERKNGRVPILKPGDSHSFNLKFSIALDGDQIKKVENHIREIQGDLKTEFDPKPVEGICY